MRLGELSTLETERGRAMLAVLLETSPLIRFFEQNSAFEEQGTEFTYAIVDGKAVLQRRSIGGEYDPDQRVPPGMQAGQLAFVGDALDIDRSHVEDDRRGLLKIENWITRHLRKSGRRWAKLYEQELMRGSGTGVPLQVTGLETILDGVNTIPGFPGYTAVQDAAEPDPAGGTSFDLSNPDHWDAFIEAMTLWTTEVDDPAGILVNKLLYARLYTIARRKHILGESRDLFGVPVDTFNRIPLVMVGNDVITPTEADNAGTPNLDTTSLYIAAPGEAGFSIVSNSGLDFHDVDRLEKKESHRIKWEIRSNLSIQEKGRVLRVRNIKL